VGAWQIWADVNCNCEIDRGDYAVEGDKGIVFPNDSFSSEKKFELKPGCYIIVYTYFTLSDLDVNSDNCTQSVGASSEVVDVYEALIEIQ
jgi:hypothetical protein